MVDWWWLGVMFYLGLGIGVALTPHVLRARFSGRRDRVASEVEAWLKGRSE